VKNQVYDYTSLYLSTQKAELFPTGHPSIICENFEPYDGRYFGIIKCQIIPPRKLYIPALPVKVNGKLHQNQTRK
jgi:hypothetical protein